MAVSEKHQIGPVAGQEFQGVVQAIGDAAVRFPGHGPIQPLQGGIERRVARTNFDGLEQQSGAALGECAEAEFRTAGQLSQGAAQPGLDEFQPAYGLAVHFDIRHVHAAGNVHHGDVAEHRPSAGALPGQAGGDGQKKSRGQQPESRIASHGRPRTWPGRVVHRRRRVRSSGGSLPLSTCSNSGARRWASSSWYLASQSSGWRRKALR